MDSAKGFFCSCTWTAAVSTLGSAVVNLAVYPGDFFRWPHRQQLLLLSEVSGLVAEKLIVVGQLSSILLLVLCYA